VTVGSRNGRVMYGQAQNLLALTNVLENAKYLMCCERCGRKNIDKSISSFHRN
jgi:hypothetical protein